MIRQSDMINRASELRRSSSANRLRRVPSLVGPVTYRYNIRTHTTRLQKLTKTFEAYNLTLKTTASVVVGLTVGLLCRPYTKGWTERQFMYIEFPGELYLRFLKLMIIPLLVSNVIVSFGKIHSKIIGHLGRVSTLLYLCSNLIAIIVGILIVLIICPGCKQSQHNHEQNSRLKETVINENNRPAYLNEYHDSIDRYRDYHPMFYHTSGGGNSVDDQVTRSVADRTLDERVEVGEEKKVLVLESEDGKAHRSVAFASTRFNHGATDKIAIGPVQTRARPSVQQTSGISTKLPTDVLLDVLRNLVPDSIIGATMQQTRTRLFPPQGLVLLKNGSTDPPPSHWPMGHEMMNQSNIIGLLAVSVFIGVVLSNMEEAAAPLINLCECVAELSLRISMTVINLSPYCIMFLLIGQVARARDLSLMAGELCFYCLTILIGLVIHSLVIMPLIFYSITRRSPIDFFFGMIEALVASLATSSSSASMALTLRCLSDLKLHPTIVRAFGPLGLVFNMNGTTIYEVIGAIFIAQTLNVSLPITSILLIGLSSIVASFSTSGIPSSGLITMVIVLDTVNLPSLRLSLIYIVDFIIDRLRTVVNVWTGAIVCGIINSICPESQFEHCSENEKSMNIKGPAKGLMGTRHEQKQGQKASEPPQVICVTITPPGDESSSM